MANCETGSATQTMTLKTFADKAIGLNTDSNSPRRLSAPMRETHPNKKRCKLRIKTPSYVCAAAVNTKSNSVKHRSLLCCILVMSIPKIQLFSFLTHI